MPTPYRFITSDELTDRLSADVVRQILDDDNDGAADDDPLDRLILDASSMVAGKLRGIYPLDLLASVRPNEVVRLTLDVAEALAAKRHPEHVRGKDWEKLLKAARTDLDDLRNGKSALDIDAAPEPGQQVGGDVLTGPPATEDEPTRKFFLDGTGDF